MSTANTASAARNPAAPAAPRPPSAAIRASSRWVTWIGPGLARPKRRPGASPAAGLSRASRPAARSAAAASTSPNPVAVLYPAAGRRAAELIIACSTWAGESPGYADRIRVATPATKADAGLVPLACR